MWCIKVFRSSISRKASSGLSKQVKLTSVGSLTCLGIPLERASSLRTPSQSASQWATEQNWKLSSTVHTDLERQLQVAFGKILHFFSPCLNCEKQGGTDESYSKRSSLYGDVLQLLYWITVVTVVHRSITLQHPFYQPPPLVFQLFLSVTTITSTADTVKSHWFRCICGTWLPEVVLFSLLFPHHKWCLTVMLFLWKKKKLKGWWDRYCTSKPGTQWKIDFQ